MKPGKLATAAPPIAPTPPIEPAAAPQLTATQVVKLEGIGRPRTPGVHAAAVEALAAADPALGRLIARVGPCGLRAAGLRTTPFDSLLEAIVYQQLNGKAAATILGRVKALFPRRRPTAARLAAIDVALLRGAGLSAAKTAALKDLAAHALRREIPTRAALARMDDEAIVERLSAVRGVGRWTVEMMLIFQLGRLDVLPATDYGVRKGFALTCRRRAGRRAVDESPLPTPAEVLARGERWRPYRSVASWYLWRAAD